MSSTRSAYRNFGLAEMDFHMALIKGSEGKYMDAAMHLNQALKQLRSNQRRFPQFTLNGKTLGLLNAYLSTVPDQYNWAVRILGFQGNLEIGMQQLEKISRSTDSPGEVGIYPKEATYLLAFATSHVQRNPERGMQILSDRIRDEDRSLLTCFFKANLAFKLRHNSDVIALLEQRPQHADYTPFHLLEYMLGAAYLFQLDERCVIHLNNYLDRFPGTNYKQASRMRLSWWYLLQGQTERADALRRSIAQQRGQAVTEEDLLAERYAEKSLPNPTLLRSRLLFDGGAYEEALAQIRGHSFNDYSSAEERTEYCYRKARIYMEMNRWKLAVEFFEAAVELGVHSSEYYGAYSCLYLADRYSELKEWTKAESYYRKALEFPENKEFRDTIEQQARSGIHRCRKSRG